MLKYSFIIVPCFFAMCHASGGGFHFPKTEDRTATTAGASQQPAGSGNTSNNGAQPVKK